MTLKLTKEDLEHFETWIGSSQTRQAGPAPTYSEEESHAKSEKLVTTAFLLANYGHSKHGSTLYEELVACDSDRTRINNLVLNKRDLFFKFANEYKEEHGL